MVTWYVVDRRTDVVLAEGEGYFETLRASGYEPPDVGVSVLMHYERDRPATWTPPVDGGIDWAKVARDAERR